MYWICGKSIGRREFFQVAGAFGSAGWLTTAADADEQPPVWSSQIVRLQPTAGHPQPPVVTALALHPQRTLLAIGGDDHLIRVWDIAGERFVQILKAHNDWVRSLAYSPDGALLASVGNDRRLILWDAASGAKQFEQQAGGHALSAVHFAHGSTQIVTVGFGDALRVYDVQSGRLLRELACPCVDMRALTMSPDGEWFAGGGRNGRIRIWNSRRGTIDHEYAVHQQRIRGLAFSPDSRLLASCGEDRRVHIFRLGSSDGFALPRLTTKILSLVFCGPHQLATGGSDNLVRIWDLSQRVEVNRLEGHTGSVAALAFNGELLVSAGYDTTVRVWRPRPNLAELDVRPIRRAGAVPRGVIGS